MNYSSYNGYQSRRSGTGGGCGCGCKGAPSGMASGGSNVGANGLNPGYHTPAQYQIAYQMPMPYQPTMDQPMYQQSMSQPSTNQYSMHPKPTDIPAPTQTVLKLLEEAVSGEKEDRIFYQQLIELAPTTTEKDIIAGIRDDEIAHYAQFRVMYQQLSGKEVGSRNVLSTEEQPLSYIANLRKALFGEMAAVKKYRKIRAELTSKQHRDILFDIITDELIHAGKYNYLITLNKRN